MKPGTTKLDLQLGFSKKSGARLDSKLWSKLGENSALFAGVFASTDLSLVDYGAYGGLRVSF